MHRRMGGCPQCVQDPSSDECTGSGIIPLSRSRFAAQIENILDSPDSDSPDVPSLAVVQISSCSVVFGGDPSSPFPSSSRHSDINNVVTNKGTSKYCSSFDNKISNLNVRSNGGNFYHNGCRPDDTLCIITFFKFQPRDC